MHPAREAAAPRPASARPAKIGDVVTTAADNVTTSSAREGRHKDATRRIAMISEHASPLATLGGTDAGGQNVYVEAVSRRLAKAGHRVDVFTRRDRPRVAEVVEWRPGARTYHVPAGDPAEIPKEELLPLMPAFRDWTLGHMARQKRPYDLMHANFWMSGLVAADIKARTGLPYVVTFHALGRVRRRFQGGADRFPDERFEIEERVAREADLIIAECPQDARDLVDLYGADPERLRVVPCGYDPALFQPIDRREARRRLGLDPQERVVLQLGRLVPRKGVDTVISAIAILRDRHDLFVRLLVVGGAERRPDPASDPELARLMGLVDSLRLGDRVTFIGRRDRKELRDLYGAADVFVSTPWYEPFGITPVEAMACGVPVIGSAVGGIKSTVADGETGYLVPPRDPDALAERIARCYEQPGLLPVLGRLAERRASTLFTWDRVAKLLEAAYDEVLGPGRWRLTTRSLSTPRRQLSSAGSISPRAVGIQVNPGLSAARVAVGPDSAGSGVAADVRAPTPRTILFDKDGTLIEDVPNNVDPELIRLAPGAEASLHRLGALGFGAAIVTNQPGVARGLFTLRDLGRVRDRLAELLAEQGVPLRGFYACPHFPMGSVAEFAVTCDCRKPGGGLVRQAIEELGLVAADTWMIGDSWADVAAGRSAGCRTILVGPEWRLGPLLPPGRQPEVAVPDLTAGIEAVLADLGAHEGAQRRERGKGLERDRASDADAAGRSEPEQALSRL